MKIVKPGKTIIEFTCDTCGCVFRANKDEYKFSPADVYYSRSNYQIKCPCCDALIKIDKANAKFCEDESKKESEKK